MSREEIQSIIRSAQVAFPRTKGRTMKVTKDSAGSLELDGLQVHLYRLEGMLTVAIESEDCDIRDTFPPHEVPRLRVVVNDDSEILTHDGTWTTDVPS